MTRSVLAAFPHPRLRSPRPSRLVSTEPALGGWVRSVDPPRPRAVQTKLRRLLCALGAVLAWSAMACSSEERKFDALFEEQEESQEQGAEPEAAGDDGDSAAPDAEPPASGDEQDDLPSDPANPDPSAEGGEPAAGEVDPGPLAVAPASSRGAALALTYDDQVLLAVNRDVGSVSVFDLTFPEAAGASIEQRQELDLGPGSEPWQVAIAPDNQTGFVVLRRDQRLVRLDALGSQASVGASAVVGSEPTAVALSPSGRFAYVSNWSDGTLSVVDTDAMTVFDTVDLNQALVASGLLGPVASRPGLAHPRSIAVTNDGDGDDLDESVFVTEYFAQRAVPEAADASNADETHVGVVYRWDLGSGELSTVLLLPLADLGFQDEAGATAGCYPNQLQSITIQEGLAYVTSVCASPRGPIGPRITTNACVLASDCVGLVEPACVVVAEGAAPVCVDLASTKTTTAPLLSVIDIDTSREVAPARVSLNQHWQERVYEALGRADDATRRFPLFANDLAFVPETGVGYLSANGADAVFRLVFDAQGSIAAAAAPVADFINLNPAGIAPGGGGIGPLGVQITHLTHNGQRFAIALNDITRNVSLLDLNAQGVLGGVSAPVVASSSQLPVPGSLGDQQLRGKRFFNTGLARWSLKGQGWGACQSCHSDGLTDNVTFYFARGPRQSVSLDGTFASDDPSDQRILNWTAVFDEIADFELNTRGVSGGVGAIVSDAALATANRIDLAGLGHAGLSGSAAAAADVSNPLALTSGSVLADWAEITEYIKTIRSPRGVSTSASDDISAGRELFLGANCQGCHGDAKWTVSRLFYTPSALWSSVLPTTSFAAAVSAAGFPENLLPAQDPADQVLRFAGANVAALDQLVCALRNVDSFGVAESDVADAGAFPELRANGAVAQGDEAAGRGYNPPSLLGGATGAPYLHHGGVRTLEGLFAEDARLAPHYRALSPNFLLETGEARATQVRQLVAFLLSIDEDSEPIPVPALGPSGGSFCATSF